MKLTERLNILARKLSEDSFSNMTDRVRDGNTPPLTWMYNTLYPENGIPTFVEFDLNIGAPLTLLDFLKEKDFIEIFKSQIVTHKNRKLNEKTVCLATDDGFIISLRFDSKNHNSKDNRVKEWIESITKDTSVTVPTRSSNSEIYHICEIIMFAPSPSVLQNTRYNELIEEIKEWLNVNDYNEDEENSAMIHMLIKDEYGLEFKDFDVSKNAPKLEKPDLFYGDDFSSFNSKLINRLDKEKKGVVLFHGIPGTGKTHYIRYLLRELTKINKRVIYIPPSMVEGMTDPAMMSFLTNNIIEEGRDTIMLIEDAEPLLESRENGNVRTTGISNLLNSTDGLLNDILGLVIIATFNTELSKIDSALLRPGRLMARKEFGKMNHEKCLAIAEELKIIDKFKEKSEIDKEYTIAEICSFAEDQEVILHEIKEDNKRNKIGFGNS
jgi:hypothetical protein